MGKFKKFFIKNYDYYTIIGLILFSIMIEFLSTYSTAFNNYSPCFLTELEHFNEWASLEIEDLIHIPFSSQILKIISENIIQSIVIFGSYFFGKLLYKKFNNKYLKITLRILFFVYVMIILIALLYLPIGRCILFSKLF